MLWRNHLLNYTAPRWNRSWELAIYYTAMLLDVIIDSPAASEATDM